MRVISCKLGVVNVAFLGVELSDGVAWAGRAEKEANEGLPPTVFVAGPFLRLAKSNAGFLMPSVVGGIEGVDVEDVVDFGDAIGVSLPGTGE